MTQCSDPERAACAESKRCSPMFRKYCNPSCFHPRGDGFAWQESICQRFGIAPGLGVIRGLGVTRGVGVIRGLGVPPDLTSSSRGTQIEGRDTDPHRCC
jgi:hypothetical protein